MKTMKKLIALLLALVMVMAALAACDGNKETEPSKGTEPAGTQGTEPVVTEPGLENEERYGGHVNIHCGGGLNNIDPTKKLGIWHYLWTTAVYEGPLTRDVNNDIQAGVCDFELAEDQSWIKLWVREGKAFHNGDPVDIYDVEATIKRSGVMYNAINSKFAPFVESYEIDDATQVLTIKFNDTRESILYYLAAYQTWMGIIPKEICEKYPDSIIYEPADAIGTGPYYISDYLIDDQLTITKWEDYQVMEEDVGKTGFAGPKYGYLDSMTFYNNDDTSSVIMGLLAGDYDIVNSMTEEYAEMWQSAGIKQSRYPSLQGIQFAFNTYGEVSVSSKYPSIRKAVMAAIDYDEYMRVCWNNEHKMGGYPIANPKYETDVFEKADYYGPTNLEAVEKYKKMAMEEGWNGTDPLRYVYGAGSSAEPTMFQHYFEQAGIPLELVPMEGSAAVDYFMDPMNHWDFTCLAPNYAISPTLMSLSVSTTYWNNPEKEALLEEMASMVPESPEYMAAWERLAQYWVDDCACPYMAFLEWFWYHDEELVTNDPDTIQRYFYNAYWTNPADHQG